MLRQQRLFRWAAQAIAVALSKVPEVEKVAAFGAAAQPLRTEVPRFRDFRRYGIETLHECADLDLAIWLGDLSRLDTVKRAMARGLALTQDTPYGGVAHHQVDVHVFDSANGQYRGDCVSSGSVLNLENASAAFRAAGRSRSCRRFRALPVQFRAVCQRAQGNPV